MDPRRTNLSGSEQLGQYRLLGGFFAACSAWLALGGLAGGCVRDHGGDTRALGPDEAPGMDATTEATRHGEQEAELHQDAEPEGAVDAQARRESAEEIDGPGAGRPEGGDEAQEQRDAGGDADADREGQGNTVRVCGPLEPLEPGSACTVAHAVSPNGYSVYRGVVLAPDTVYDGGEVLVDDKGTIACVGCDCSAIPSYSGAIRVTCPEGVISPGLINAHDHITYGNNPPYGRGDAEMLSAVRYEHRHEWRAAAPDYGKPKIDARGGASARVQAAVELRFLMSGGTSINGSGGVGGILRNLDDGTKLEGIEVAPVEYRTFPLGDAVFGMLDAGCGYPNIDTTAEAQSYGFYVPHVAEGTSVASRNEVLCLSRATTDLMFSRAAWVHGIGLTAGDIRDFSRRQTKLIWSPRSNMALYGDTARVPLFHKAGVIIALGTDWVVTGSMNLERELSCVHELNDRYFARYFSDDHIWRMVTTNAAFATGFHHALGLLKTGHAADIAIFDGRFHRTYAAVTRAGLADVWLVLRAGQPLYGNASLMTDLGKGSCEDMPIAADALDQPTWSTGVCGVPKKVCTRAEPNAVTDVASAANAVAAYYPLYFCGTPAHEPSCVPFRPNQYPIENDRDGDGVVDTVDNCPDVFNPIRALDDARQEDFDGDGIGDVCDPCPFDRSNRDCENFALANDLDRDGIPNGTDNCPTGSNPDQADGDGDGHGDACDFCPADPNPGPVRCPPTKTTIERARMLASLGDTIILDQVVVTGVRNVKGNYQGAYVSDPSAGPGRCLFVYMRDIVPPWSVGDRLAITGVLGLHDGLEEIQNGATITLLGGGSKLPEIDVRITDLVGSEAESYESCRVRIRGIEGVSLGNEIGVAQNGQSIRVSAFIWSGIGPFVKTGQRYAELRGFAGFFHDARELLPQIDADLVPSP